MASPSLASALVAFISSTALMELIDPQLIGLFHQHPKCGEEH